MEISEDWTDLLRLLLESNAKFVVVGGHAMGVHGLPRYTKDLDIFVDRSLENAKLVQQSLIEFMGDDKGFGIENFTNPKKVTMLGFPPYRIDILTSIAGVSFQQVFKNQELLQFGDLQVPFIGYEAVSYTHLTLPTTPYV